MVWCYKANFKTNLSRLKTLKEELRSYSFKYVNCKGKYQIDSYNCSFWKHKFNCDWHIKKAQELREIKANSICSTMSSSKA